MGIAYSPGVPQLQRSSPSTTNVFVEAAHNPHLPKPVIVFEQPADARVLSEKQLIGERGTAPFPILPPRPWRTSWGVACIMQDGAASNIFSDCRLPRQAANQQCLRVGEEAPWGGDMEAAVQLLDALGDMLED